MKDLEEEISDLHSGEEDVKGLNLLEPYGLGSVKRKENAVIAGLITSGRQDTFDHIQLLLKDLWKVKVKIEDQLLTASGPFSKHNNGIKQKLEEITAEFSNILSNVEKDHKAVKSLRENQEFIESNENSENILENSTYDPNIRNLNINNKHDELEIDTSSAVLYQIKTETNLLVAGYKSKEANPTVPNTRKQSHRKPPEVAEQKTKARRNNSPNQRKPIYNETKPYKNSKERESSVELSSSGSEHLLRSSPKERQTEEKNKKQKKICGVNSSKSVVLSDGKPVAAYVNSNQRGSSNYKEPIKSKKLNEENYSIDDEGLGSPITGKPTLNTSQQKRGISTVKRSSTKKDSKYKGNRSPQRGGHKVTSPPKSLYEENIEDEKYYIEENFEKSTFITAKQKRPVKDSHTRKDPKYKSDSYSPEKSHHTNNQKGGKGHNVPHKSTVIKEDNLSDDDEECESDESIGKPTSDTAQQKPSVAGPAKYSPTKKVQKYKSNRYSLDKAHTSNKRGSTGPKVPNKSNILNEDNLSNDDEECDSEEDVDKPTPNTAKTKPGAEPAKDSPTKKVPKYETNSHSPEKVHTTHYKRGSISPKIPNKSNIVHEDVVEERYKEENVEKPTPNTAKTKPGAEPVKDSPTNKVPKYKTNSHSPEKVHTTHYKRGSISPKIPNKSNIVHEDVVEERYKEENVEKPTSDIAKGKRSSGPVKDSHTTKDLKYKSNSYLPEQTHTANNQRGGESPNVPHKTVFNENISNDGEEDRSRPTSNTALKRSSSPEAVKHKIDLENKESQPPKFAEKNKYKKPEPPISSQLSDVGITEKLRHKHQECNELLKENIKLRKAIDKTALEIRKLKLINRQLKNAKDSLEIAKEKNTEENALLMKRLRMLQNELEKCREIINLKNQLSEKLAKATLELNECKDINKEQKNRLNSLITDEENQLSDLESKIECLNIKKEEINAKQKELEDKNKYLESEGGDIRSSYEERLSVQSDRIKMAEARVITLEKMPIIDEQQALEDLKRENQMLNENIKQLNEQKTSLQCEKLKLSKRNESCERMLNTIANENEGLRNERFFKESARRDQENELSLLRSEQMRLDHIINCMNEKSMEIIENKNQLIYHLNELEQQKVNLLYDQGLLNQELLRLREENYQLDLKYQQILLNSCEKCPTTDDNSCGVEHPPNGPSAHPATGTSNSENNIPSCQDIQGIQVSINNRIRRGQVYKIQNNSSGKTTSQVYAIVIPPKKREGRLHVECKNRLPQKKKC